MLSGGAFVSLDAGETSRRSAWWASVAGLAVNGASTPASPVRLPVALPSP